MRRVLITALATAAAAGLAISTPAYADIINQSASASQGTLVHGTGTDTTAYDIVANLGSNGPNIVHFNGDTTQTASTSDLLHLQGGSGQADVTGAVISGNNTYPFYSGDIFLTGHAGMSWLEFALTGTDPNGSVTFTVTDNLGGNTVFNLVMGSGDTHFAFEGINGQSITNLHFVANTPPGTIDLIKQVRIIAAPGAIPEPGTWGMMLLGFTGIGMALRRSRRRSGALLQIA
jgi:hypothetical protein